MATKRKGLDALDIATRARAAGDSPSTQGATRETLKANSVNMPAELWTLLNRLAFKRSQIHGGRASVSAIIAELVRKHEAELRKELDE